MRRTVPRLKFINNRCLRINRYWQYHKNSDCEIIDRPKPFLTALQYVNTTFENYKPTYWFKDLSNDRIYPVVARDFETFIPHINGGIIVGVFNPTVNSGSASTLELMNVDINLLKVETPE